MHLKILFIIWLIDAAFAKNFHWEVTLDVENSCGNPGGPGNAKPLLLKGIRLVVFEKDGNAGWGKVVATLVQIPKMKGQAEGNDDRRMGFPLNIMIPADNVYDEKKEAAQIKALEGINENNVQLYLYVDDFAQTSPINFGAPHNLFTRNSYDDSDENPYHQSPVRFKSIEVTVKTDKWTKTVVKKSTYDAPRGSICTESTTDWIVRPGIYRLNKCGGPTNHCKGHQWDTTYFDPYNGYVRI